MKTLSLAIVAMIVTLNLFAQEPSTTMEPQQQKAAVQNTQPDGLVLKDNMVWLTENGQTKAITGEIYLRNETRVTPSGTLIFASGERAKLRAGDFVDMNGAVARPIPIGTEVAYDKSGKR